MVQLAIFHWRTLWLYRQRFQNSIKIKLYCAEPELLLLLLQYLYHIIIIIIIIIIISVIKLRTEYYYEW